MPHAIMSRWALSAVWLCSLGGRHVEGRSVVPCCIHGRNKQNI